MVNGWGKFGVVTDGSTKVYLADNADKGGTKSVAGQSAWSDYSMEAMVKVNTWQNGAGLIARYVDSNNYYYMTYDKVIQNVSIRKRVNGKETILAHSGKMTPPAEGVYHQFNFEVSGNTLKAYIDGQLMATATDNTFTNGKIGVYAHLQQAYFDDIVVKQIVMQGK